ncbi:unnamed protein product [Amoebophrya sp. A120]|nr:unnamed protein product [Amoebophrya sp. A120]|eukprot:GSA120T00019044001.1
MSGSSSSTANTRKAVVGLSSSPVGIIGTGMMAATIPRDRPGKDTRPSVLPNAGRRSRRALAEKIQKGVRSSGVSLVGGDWREVAEQCPVLILAVPTNIGTDDGVNVVLKQEFLGKAIRGKGKVLIDITYFGRGAWTRGNPARNGYASAVAYHRDCFDMGENGDANLTTQPSRVNAAATTHWASGFKSVAWTSLRDGKRQGIEIVGDATGKAVLAEIVSAIGFTPLDCGDIDSGSPLIEPGGPQRKPHPGADV